MKKGKKVTLLDPSAGKAGSKQAAFLAIAEQKLREAVRLCKFKYPGMIYPLSKMERFPVKERVGVSTDGYRILYNPEQVKEIADREGTAGLEVRIMHIILHGMLGHFQMTELYAENLPLIWWCMDLAVFCMLERLKGNDLTHLLGEHVEFPHKFYLENCGKKRMAAKLRRTGLVVGGISLLGTRYDDHALWYPVKEDAEEGTAYGEEEAAAPVEVQMFLTFEGEVMTGSGKGDAVRAGKVREFWAMARRITFGAGELSMGDFMRLEEKDGYGTEGGNAELTVSEWRGRPISYRELLRDFLKLREERAEDQENPDMMLYCYGLELYQDTPLVEPLEEGNVKEIGTIAIAIDISGSCLGDTLSRFLAETGQMLRDLRELGQFRKVILMQFDARITKEVVINGEWELQKQEILRNPFGGGGTDFRPVFQRVEELERAGEKVDALIFLTDGWGSYPEKKREDTFFVMEPEQFDRETGKPEFGGMPEWIRTVMLNRDQG